MIYVTALITALLLVYLGTALIRSNLGEAPVIYITVLITALLFVYLGTALVRPEWF